RPTVGQRSLFASCGPACAALPVRTLVLIIQRAQRHYTHTLGILPVTPLVREQEHAKGARAGIGGPSAHEGLKLIRITQFARLETIHMNGESDRELATPPC
ncbi:MAG: hypothetical protein P4N59_05400, partial [Negativicutes bacterium]|nr:hypothetical protein [Negativicutes bacterium]